jgi:hypothetical protein
METVEDLHGQLKHASIPKDSILRSTSLALHLRTLEVHVISLELSQLESHNKVID